MELKDKRVLITGGAGFVGSNLTHRLVREGADVTILDAFFDDSGANLANLGGVRDEITLVEGDVRDRATVADSVDDVDLLFHLAAATSHTLAVDDPLDNLDVNVRGTLVLLESLREAAPDTRLVHVGTSTQAGPMRTEPIDEDHTEFPTGIYSANKVAQEKLSLVYHRAHGLNVAVVRLCNTYGSRARIDSPDFGFVNYFIGLGLMDRPITVFGEGDQRRGLLHVDDAVDALVRAATEDAAVGDVFLAAGDDHPSVADIARAIADHVGGTVQHRPWPEEREAVEVGDVRIDSSKLRNRLGWTPRVDLAHGLERTAAYFRPRLDAYLDPPTTEGSL